MGSLILEKQMGSWEPLEIHSGHVYTGATPVSCLLWRHWEDLVYHKDIEDQTDSGVNKSKTNITPQK